ncbi:hypothetical protein PSEUDO8BK_40541 [Pseudomonas sp. 8BK]|nr:hypothetical protein PSEUDO8BK_40541 [Pseudomonas sp. 8BK]
MRQAKRGSVSSGAVGEHRCRWVRAAMHYKSQALRLDLGRVRNSWGKSTIHGRELHEASHCHHQAVQAGRRP